MTTAPAEPDPQIAPGEVPDASPPSGPSGPAG